MDEMNVGTEMNNVDVDAATNTGIVPEFNTDLSNVGEDDGNAALGIALLLGAGTLIGIGAKAGFDAIRRKVTEGKDEKPEKEKKPGFFAKFKKEKNEDKDEPEVVAETEAKEVEEPQEEAQKQEATSNKKKK